MKKLDTFVIGLVVGVVGFVLGFVLLGLIWSTVQDASFSFFYNEAFIKAPMYKVKILSASSILNVVLFGIGFQKEYYNLCKGIMGILILTLLGIVIFY